jgi:hypothetical protein
LWSVSPEALGDRGRHRKALRGARSEGRKGVKLAKGASSYHTLLHGCGVLGFGFVCIIAALARMKGESDRSLQGFDFGHHGIECLSSRPKARQLGLYIVY